MYSKKLCHIMKKRYRNLITNTSLNPSQSQNGTEKRNRKQKIIWFNPPFNKNLSTNIGKCFLRLIQKHFPENHRFHKIFNKNTIKISYSCMPNMDSIINSHNKNILKPSSPAENDRTCNCVRREDCPLNQNCLQSKIIYQATIKSELVNYGEKKYIGLCETTFKKRYASHKTSFTNKKYQHNTTLSTEFWRVKELNGNPSITWEKIGKAEPFNVESGRCLLCLNEKFEIANYPYNNLLNKRTEVIAKCRHMNKFNLSSYNTND